jgi:uncharacterized repeat protein (TIGR01451 family)
LILILTMAISPFVISGAYAATLTVNCAADNTTRDTCLTLREALLIARGGTGPQGLNRSLHPGESGQIAGATFSGPFGIQQIASGAGAGYQDTIVFADTFVRGSRNPQTGAFHLVIDSPLPPLDDAGDVIDATALANPGPALGSGGTVGTLGRALPGVPRPAVAILARPTGGALPIGLDVRAAGVQIRGVAVSGFGNAPDSDSSANLRLTSAAASVVVEGSVIGALANGAQPSTAGERDSNGSGVRVVGAHGNVFRENYLAFLAGPAFALRSGALDNRIEANQTFEIARGNPDLAALAIEEGSRGHTIGGNRLARTSGAGLDIFDAPGFNEILENDITENGLGWPGLPADETAGVRLYGEGNQVLHNRIWGNYGPGVLVTSGSFGNVIQENSIWGNGRTSDRAGNPPTGAIGIDLVGDPAFDQTGDGVNPNDGDSDQPGVGNRGIDFPVIAFAEESGGLTLVEGTAPPGARVDLYLADDHPTGYGEGPTWLGATTAAGDGSWSALLTGAPPASEVTATATLPAAGTSEFAQRVVVTGGDPLVSATKTGTLFHQGVAQPAGTPALPGDRIRYTITITNSGTGLARFLLVRDPIPGNTTYVPGSLSLDSDPLTDELDADLGHYDAGAREIVVGNRDGLYDPQAALDLPPNSTRVIEFEVEVGPGP